MLEMSWSHLDASMMKWIVSSFVVVYGKCIPDVRNDMVRAANLASAGLQLSPDLKVIFARDLTHNQK
jgi:hypothetical protein